MELQTPETAKLFGSTEKFIEKTKNGGQKPSLEVLEVVLVQCNLVDNQYQQKSEDYTRLLLIRLILICSTLNQVN